MGDVLIISFAFNEPNLVGSFRCTFWANKLVESGYSVSVVTASQVKQNDNERLTVIHVPYSAEKNFSLLHDQGFSWMKAVMQIIENRDSNAFASIIISGGPFLQMLWSKQLKLKFNARLILDFRDPFANNPRFKDSFIKKFLKSILEKRMCVSADHVITVNSFTAELLTCPKEKICIIENGFDEDVIQSITREAITKGRIVHAGKVGLDRDPMPLIQVVQRDVSYSFEHYGNTIEQTKPSDRVLLNDFVPYNNVLQAISRAEFGLVLTGGDPFVSTTKIFDYIGLEKKVLIITQGELNSGNLGEISKRNPNIYWSKNNESEIAEILRLASQKPYVPIETAEFSRGYQFLKLKNLLES